MLNFSLFNEVEKEQHILDTSAGKQLPLTATDV